MCPECQEEIGIEQPCASDEIQIEIAYQIHCLKYCLHGIEKNLGKVVRELSGR